MLEPRVASLPALPPLPGDAPSNIATWVKRLAKDCIPDRTHLEQLKAYCRAQASPKDQDLSFARSCRLRGWSESTAERNVEKAITALVIAMNVDADL